MIKPLVQMLFERSDTNEQNTIIHQYAHTNAKG